MACCTQLTFFKSKENSHPPSCVKDGLFVNKPGGHLLWGWRLSPSLSFLDLPIVLSDPVLASLAGAGEISEAFKVTRSKLTCQYSCPIPVRGSAGDKGGFKGQRICYCSVYCDVLDLPAHLSLSSTKLKCWWQVRLWKVTQIEVTSHANRKTVSPTLGQVMCGFLYLLIYVL